MDELLEVVVEGGKVILALSAIWLLGTGGVGFVCRATYEAFMLGWRLL